MLAQDGTAVPACPARHPAHQCQADVLGGRGLHFPQRVLRPQTNWPTAAFPGICPIKDKRIIPYILLLRGGKCTPLVTYSRSKLDIIPNFVFPLSKGKHTCSPSLQI
ncbi:hypothetical protein AMELA_G00112500 [Ameiurus melas]|uniref:Uncharacterized protein n=1 Tax=Ameiurus melas TaxID=219545 RepID=A0A7J6AQK6_AMEME|nr:hypothetical protein AMELA_G00112500 [Ameiurus melas]